MALHQVEDVLPGEARGQCGGRRRCPRWFASERFGNQRLEYAARLVGGHGDAGIGEDDFETGENDGVQLLADAGHPGWSAREADRHVGAQACCDLLPVDGGAQFGIGALQCAQHGGCVR